MKKQVFAASRNTSTTGIIYVLIFFLLTIAYVVLSIVIKPDPASLRLYQLSILKARIITISVVVPLVLIWTAGLFGSMRMRNYAHLVRHSKEGKGLLSLSRGLLFLVITQPLAALIGTLVGLIGRHNPGWIPAMTIINNYLNIIFMAGAFILIGLGAQQLLSLVRSGASFLEKQLWVFGAIILATFYSYFLAIEPFHDHQLQPRQYFMPIWLVLLTIAIPYVFIWYRGSSAAYALYDYQRKVKGHLYKSSLSYVAAGIAVVVLSSVTIRLITTVSYRLTRLKLTPLLLIIYGLIVLSGIGYLLIAWGAKKLRKIEEV